MNWKLTIIIFVLLTTLIPVSGSTQARFKIVQADSSVNLLNEHGVFMTELDVGLFSILDVETAIKNSDHEESKLIVSVLKMHVDQKSKMKELLNLRSTYVFVNDIVDQHIYENLKSKYGRRKVNKMMRRTE